MTDIPPEPRDLQSLGQRLDEARRRDESRKTKPAPSPLGIAFRFTAELVGALAVGGGLGWALDWVFGTRPIFIIVFFCLGAAAGIHNVLHAAKKMNAQAAKSLEK